jgi:guanylate kinase
MDIEELIANYRPSQAGIDLVRDTKIVLLSGVSGAGKNTIIAELLKKPDYMNIVSHTTRKPRVNDGAMEKTGQNYYFIGTTTAEKMLKNGEFFEAKFVHGHIYGTSLAEIQRIHDLGKIAITDLDVKGVEVYKKFAPSVRAIFILPPNDKEWHRRLLTRGHISANDLEKRIETSKFEMKFAKKHQYFDFVVNDDLATAVKEVNNLARQTNS